MERNNSNKENRKADALRQKMEHYNGIVLSQTTAIKLDDTIKHLCNQTVKHIKDTEYLRASAQIVTALASYRSLICKI